MKQHSGQTPLNQKTDRTQRKTCTIVLYDDLKMEKRDLWGTKCCLITTDLVYRNGGGYNRSKELCTSCKENCIFMLKDTRGNSFASYPAHG
jgi:hypothetical protein